MIQPLFVFSDYGLLFLRVVLGLILTVHGWPKLKNFKGTAEWFGSVGLKPAKFWVAVVALTEFFGGLFLIAGLLVQVAAVLIAIEFIVIILKINLKKGLVGGYEFDLLILAAALLLASTGGGIYGADELLGLILY